MQNSWLSSALAIDDSDWKTDNMKVSTMEKTEPEYDQHNLVLDVQLLQQQQQRPFNGL